MTASLQDQRILLRTAIVTDVDEVHWRIGVQFVGNEALATDIPVTGAYVSARGGGWLGAMPRKGDMVLLAKPLDSMEYYPLVFLPYPSIVDTQGDARGDEISDRGSFTAQRPPAAAGTVGMSGPSGGFAVIHPGGDIEIQASTHCLTHFFSQDDTVRTICQNMVLEGFFGVSQFLTHRSALRDGADKTPTSYQLQLKALAQHAPVLYVDAGAVLQEETLPMPGYPSLAKNTFGTGVVLRFMVFDQDSADTQAQDGLIPPDPRKAKLLIRMTQSGNMTVQGAGMLYEQWRDRTTLIQGRDVAQAGSIKRTTTEGSIDLEAATALRVSAGKEVRISAATTALYESRRHVIRTKQMLQECSGSWMARVDANFTVEGSSHGVFTFGADASFSCGGSMSQVVGGRFSQRVSNTGVAENLGRDVIAHKILVGGKAVLRAQRGSVEISLGHLPTGQIAAGLRLHHDLLRAPQLVGRATLEALLTKLILEPTGGFQLANALSSVHCDPAGRIHIGPLVGAAGHPITTMSHRDYVTGLPLMGVTDIVMTQRGPGIPLPIPAVPVIPPLPAVDFPDELEAT